MIIYLFIRVNRFFHLPVYFTTVFDSLVSSPYLPSCENKTQKTCKIDIYIGPEKNVQTLYLIV